MTNAREASESQLPTGPTVSLTVVDHPGPNGAPTILLLHATLASAASLGDLAGALSEHARVIAPDRRGSGRTPLEPAMAVPIAVHVADVVRVLDEAAVGRAVVVGHSFGGVVGLELAARHPERVVALLVWEPPYLALADAPTRARFGGLADRIAAAHEVGGAPAAAAVFFDAVNGAGAYDRLPNRARSTLGAAGNGALADAAMPDLDSEGLARILAPTIVATGGRADPIYGPIAAALVARIPGARRSDVAGLDHMAPATDPSPIAALVRELLADLPTPGALAVTDSTPASASDDKPAPTVPDGAATGSGNAAPPAQVGAMFDRIAPVYDLMNLVISGFQEPRWRGRAVAAARLEPGMSVIDVATGTGKVAGSLGEKVGAMGRVLGVDLSPGMIERARAAYSGRSNLEFVTGDALSLPAPDGAFEAATIAFGMRNLPDYERGFAEMRRVVRPGGRVVCLEIARPNHLLARIARVWFEKIVPILGRLAGQGGAYAYLVQSVQNYPGPERIAAIMREAGLVDVHWTPMTLGMVTIHVGVRPVAGDLESMDEPATDS